MMKQSKEERLKLTKGEKIIIVFLSGTIFILVAVGLYIAVIGNTIKKDIVKDLNKVSLQSVKLVNERITSSLNTLEAMGRIIGRYNGSIYENNILKAVHDETLDAGFQNMAIATLDGTAYNDNSIKVDVSDTEHFKKAIQGESIVSNVIISKDTNTKVVALATPIYREGNIIGAIMARYDLEDLSNILSTKYFDGLGYSYIVKSTGEVIAYSNDKNIDKSITNILVNFNSYTFENKEDYEILKSNLQSGINGTLFYNWNQQKQIMTYRPLGINNWYLINVIPKKLVYNKLSYLSKGMFVICTFLILVFISLTMYIIKFQRKNRLDLEKAHLELQRLYNSVPGGIYRCSIDGKFTVSFANDSFFKFIGYSKEEFKRLFNNEMCRIIHKRDIDTTRKAMYNQLINKKVINNENRIVCANGSIKWISVKSEYIENEDKNNFLYCMFFDITEKKKIIEKLRLNQERYNIIMEQVKDIVFEWNPKNKRIYYSEYFKKKFGYEPLREKFPDSMIKQNIIHKDDIEGFRIFIDKIEKGEKYSECEVRIFDTSNSYIWCKVRATALLDEYRNMNKVIGLISDIDKHKKETQKIKEWAKRDSLTNLYNKGTTETMIRQAIENKECKEKAALLVIDVDNFKSINDTLGHIYGDYVLSGLANNFSKVVSDSDIAGRIGGDEFMIFLNNIEEEEIHHKACEVVNAFESLSIDEHLDYKVSGSVGISLFPKDGQTYHELFKKADKALYCAKNNGKNQYAKYDSHFKK